MAIWQLTFNMVQINVLTGELKKSIDITDESLELLSLTLSRSKGWSDEILLFGNLDGTCVELYNIKAKITEISARLDLRSLNKSYIDAILMFIRTNKLSVLYKRDVFDINPEKLRDMVTISSAASYLKKPLTFLDEISKNKTSQ